MPIRALRVLVFSFCAFGLVQANLRADKIPTPESHLGYRPGADFRLADWRMVAEYFRKVDSASDRVQVRELGKTTEGRPYLVAFISRPDTLSRQPHYQHLQRRLSDPRISVKPGASDDPVRDSKTVVVITCSIHSSETASTLMAMELLHELASNDDPNTREILDKTIVILVPSANPDGVDKVAAWYERSKGTAWEGSGMPELYHRYAGHDTNRDWFMLNLQETRLLTRLLYKEWFPTILYDVHQMGARGPRLFVPPFYDPINPNIDPRIHQSIFKIGAHMASDLAAAGKRGIATNAIYDNWWNGGNRTTPQRHNIVAVLTEAASVKLASPIFVEPGDLRGGMRGFPDHKPTVNFADPWPGGWWRLRDIVDYELTCARSILTLAARYRDQFQSNLAAMARDAIDRGKHEPPYAWIVPSDQRDPGTAARMIGILHDTGIEIERAKSDFKAGGVRYPAGSWILPAAQPYRAHLKDMMEPQVYPLRRAANGDAEPPYDVAGWTLPLQMGVAASVIAEPFKVETETLGSAPARSGRIEGAGDGKVFVVQNQANDDFVLLNELINAKVTVYTAPNANTPQAPAGSYWFNADVQALAVLDRVLAKISTRVMRSEPSVLPVPDPPGQGRHWQLKRQSIGLYQPWVPSMDEGWTRLVLEDFRFPYTTLHNSDIQVGKLRERFDVVVLPSIDVKTLKQGFAPNETDPRHVGGLGESGAAALHEFVQEGGSLVCLDRASEYAIEAFALHVRNVLKGLRTSDFYGPGSILRARTLPQDRQHYRSDLLQGVPNEQSVYFDQSLAFDASGEGPSARVLLRYAADPLQSGWLLGPQRLADKAALVSVNVGRGQVILFGFPPQHRGQPHGTFRLLFNAFFTDAPGPTSR